MDKWIEFASKNGWALLALIALGILFYKKIWPLIERTWEKGWALIEKRLADADAREKEHQRQWKEQGESFARQLEKQSEANERRFEELGGTFTDALRTQRTLAVEAHREVLQRIDALGERKRPATQKVKRQTKKRR